MDLLTAVSTCGLFISAQCQSSSATTAALGQWQPMVSQAASQFGLPEAWVNAVIARESGGRTSLNGHPVRSKAGAMGLMQLMPQTYEDLRRQYGLGADAYAPSDNILAGTAYLRQMYNCYGYPGLFAAYNAGPGRFEAYLSARKPLPEETISYLASIVPGSETSLGHGKSVHSKGANLGATHGIFVTQSSPSALFVSLSAGHF